MILLNPLKSFLTLSLCLDFLFLQCMYVSRDQVRATSVFGNGTECAWYYPFLTVYFPFPICAFIELP